MSTKKAIGISFVAIFILIIAQIIAQVMYSPRALRAGFGAIPIPTV